MAERGPQNSAGDGASNVPSSNVPSSNISSVQSPLMDQIGGPEAMASILIPAVEIFYCKLLGDPRINRFFAGVDTERLKNKQGAFSYLSSYDDDDDDDCRRRRRHHVSSLTPKLITTCAQSSSWRLCLVLPERYTGKDIAQAHQRLIVEQGLNETHFDIVIEHFIATMRELNVPEAVLDQAVAILMTSRPVFERRPTEEDKFSVALNMLKACSP